MSRLTGVVFLVGVLLVMGHNRPVWATMDNLKTVKQAYPDRDPKASSCKLCHLNAIGKQGEHNAYGLALQKLKAPGEVKTLTVEDLRVIEHEDADGDGASNRDEILAGTNPGDSTSVPNGSGRRVE